MNNEYEFHISSPFHDAEPDNTRLNLARERTRLGHEADNCVLSLRTEIREIDAGYEKNIFVKVIRFGVYLAFAAAVMFFWDSGSGSQTARTAFQTFIAVGIGLVLINIAVWICHKNRKAKRTRYWNTRKAEFEDQKSAVAAELAKLDQQR